MSDYHINPHGNIAPVPRQEHSFFHGVPPEDEAALADMKRLAEKEKLNTTEIL